MNTGQVVIGGLAEEFWGCFPPWDVDRAFAYIRMINLEYWDGKFPRNQTCPYEKKTIRSR